MFLQEMLTLLGGILIVCFVYVIVTKKNDKLTANARSMAYTALRKLVDHTVDEVCKSQNLSDSVSNEIHNERFNENEEPGISQRRYDDLLASVIINKVIEKYQLKQLDSTTSNTLNVTSLNDKTDATLSRTIKDNNDSVELLSQDECYNNSSQAVSTFTEVPPSEALPLTIEQRIEEVTTCISEGMQDDCEDDSNIYKHHRVPFPELGMDIIDPYQKLLEYNHDGKEDSEHATMVSFVESWKENWLFQKKSTQGYSKPVAMFVPNSNTEYRAMIGDKDAEEISDLSECSFQSDEEIEEELKAGFPNLTANSTDTEFTKMSSSESNCQRNQIDTKFISTTPTKHISNDQDVNNCNGNFSNQSIDIISPVFPLKNEKSKDTSKMQGMPQDMNSTVTEKSEPENENASKDKLYFSDRNQINSIKTADIEISPTTVNENGFKEDISLFTPPLPGSIAEREHKKWENAPPIANNPYSKENIQKRLMERQYHTRYSNLSGIKNSQNNTNFLSQQQVARIVDFEMQEDTENNGENGKALNDVVPKDIICKVTKGTDESLSRLQNLSQVSNNVNEISKNKMLTQTNIEDQYSRPKEIATKVQVTNKSNVQSSDDKENDLSKSLSTDRLEENIHKENKCKSSFIKEKQFESIDFFKEFNDICDFHMDNKSIRTTSCGDITEETLITMGSSKSFPNVANKSICNPTTQNSHDHKDKNILVKTKNESDNKINKERKVPESDEYLLNNCNNNATNKLSGEISLSNEDNDTKDIINNVIMLPSVKKLVEDFNKKEQEKITSLLVIPKQISETKVQNKPFTFRRIQTNQSPKHLHSLTARSLSKEFREGLRQTPKESDISCVNQCKLYNTKKQSDHYKYCSSELKSQECRTLKNNIEFWEKLQRQK